MKLRSEPDLAPLNRELAACKVPTGRIPCVAKRLTRPPPVIARSAADDPKSGAAIAIGHVSKSRTGWHAAKLGKFAPPRRTFDGNAAAVLLYLDEGRLDTQPTWKSLSPAERKRARLRWEWFGSNHGLNVTPRGAPCGFDVALVLYLMRVLCEETGRRDFPRLNAAQSSATGKLTSRCGARSMNRCHWRKRSCSVVTPAMERAQSAATPILRNGAAPTGSTNTSKVLQSSPGSSDRNRSKNCAARSGWDRAPPMLQPVPQRSAWSLHTPANR
jgi:hypothetical protein